MAPKLPRKLTCGGISPLLTIVAGTLAAAQTTPDLRTLLDDARANQRKMDEIRENYTFRRIVRTDDLDKKGAVVRTTIAEREVFFVKGHQIERLVKKNGAPLTAEEEETEQERIRKVIERLANLRLRREGSGEAGFISGILKVIQVSNPQRVMLHDRQTLAFDFTGDPRATAHGMEQNAEKKTAGTIWIDEADHQVARFEIRLADNFRVGGGILGSVQKGTRIEVEQSPIAEGLWMPTVNQEHVDVRMVVAHERRNLLVRDSDFRRFDVNALQKIGPPSP